ncbi:uncharacterized protein [Misgurnus anguillicaudatus]|uniref:uncharacterized protein isoform X1 n=1 Tax=Misgurnus anguillicaudatus TaxID=75329 RepID=UPI003CCF01BC
MGVKRHVIFWILLLILYVTFKHGLNACQTELIANTSLTAELQSDVRLPCSFKSDLLQSNRTDTGVEWRQLTPAVVDIVEISLEGEAKFWNSKRGRIKTFPKLESGLPQFSILIRNVQQSDLGLYHCNLFREIGCLLAYKQIELRPAVVLVDSENTLTWLIPVAATGGGVVLLMLLIITFKCFKRKQNISGGPVYENTSRTNRIKTPNEINLESMQAFRGACKNTGSDHVYANTSTSQTTKPNSKKNLQTKQTFQGFSHKNPIYGLK